jgi:hypothetical protein
MGRSKGPRGILSVASVLKKRTESDIDAMYDSLVKAKALISVKDPEFWKKYWATKKAEKELNRVFLGGLGYDVGYKTK